MVRTRPQPVRGFVDMMNEMERIRSLGRRGYEPGEPSAAHTKATAWVPTTDIEARGADLVMAVELAGVARTDIDISVSDGVLTISGERHRDPTAEAITPYLRERYYGSFRRSMILPDGVDERTINARFDNGVVILTLPGAADAPASTPHQIPLMER